ncbi:MAG TPA: T9SS type A sorting domain-containing protein [Flavilitoribacter sp.]|nr:T9SS type A sorting domain-containing protein [Flavilitoribacter sp.]HMQ89752.1 T9SS type A sorting domain-containing protein [Flavilitoribacter sp.]
MKKSNRFCPNGNWAEHLFPDPENLDGIGRSVAVRLIDASAESEVRFSLDDQPPGIYLVRIEAGNGMLSVKRMVIAR